MPNVPTLSMIAIISTALAGVASTAASGSQRCSGHSGALTANANMKPPNSRCITIGFTTKSPPATAATIARKSNVPAAKASLLAVATYRPTTAASMISPPKRLYSKNFTAAALRFAPPNPPMRKYIGISMASKNT